VGKFGAQHIKRNFQKKVWGGVAQVKTMIKLISKLAIPISLSFLCYHGIIVTFFLIDKASDFKRELLADKAFMKSAQMEVKVDTSEIKEDTNEIKANTSKMKSDISKMKLDISKMKAYIKGLKLDSNRLKSP